MAGTREFQESPLVQGQDEEIVYSLTTTPWGSTPSEVTVKVWEITEGAYEDVSATVLTGAASVDGDVITLPKLSGLAAGKKYRLEVKFTAGGMCSKPGGRCWVSGREVC